MIQPMSFEEFLRRKDAGTLSRTLNLWMLAKPPVSPEEFISKQELGPGASPK